MFEEAFVRLFMANFFSLQEYPSQMQICFLLNNGLMFKVALCFRDLLQNQSVVCDLQSCHFEYGNLS